MFPIELGRLIDRVVVNETGALLAGLATAAFPLSALELPPLPLVFAL